MTLRLAGSALLVLALIGAAQVRAQSSTPEFADWTAASAGTATGTLLGHTITFSGPHVDPTPNSTVDGSLTKFSTSSFTPPLATSDAVYLVGLASPDSYELTFGAPVKDPVLHLASFASTLEFPAGTAITRVSGDAGFGVSGNRVTGAFNGSDDANGTAKLTGTFSSISFTLTYTASAQDGIYVQVGGSAPPTPATPTPTPTPTPTVTSPPPPIQGVRVATTVASGQVLVQTPSGFVPLGATAPVGAVIDARKGSLEVVSADGSEATLAAGIFRVKQQTSGLTSFVLVTPPGQARACASRRKGVVRTLSLTAKGVFRTVGAKGVATGANAAWTMSDRCDGTLTRVRRGHVSVRAARRTVKLTAGQSYLVKARLFAAKQRS